MGSVAGEGRRGGYDTIPSLIGGIEPARNGFSREHAGKGKVKREKEGGRERQGKEAREIERESAWSIH